MKQCYTWYPAFHHSSRSCGACTHFIRHNMGWNNQKKKNSRRQICHFVIAILIMIHTQSSRQNKNFKMEHLFFFFFFFPSSVEPFLVDTALLSTSFWGPVLCAPLLMNKFHYCEQLAFLDTFLDTLRCPH